MGKCSWILKPKSHFFTQSVLQEVDISLFWNLSINFKLVSLNLKSEKKCNFQLGFDFVTLPTFGYERKIGITKFLINKTNLSKVFQMTCADKEVKDWFGDKLFRTFVLTEIY